jgi:WD40 repeat protein
MRAVRLVASLIGIAALLLAALIAVDYGGPARIEVAPSIPLRAQLDRRLAIGPAPARQLAFSNDGRTFAASSADGTIRLWRIGERGRPLLLTHEGGATSLAFSGDGRLLVSGGYDGKLRLWRVEDGRPLRILAGHPGTVWTVDLSSDGQRVASGGEDRLVRLWRSADGALLKAMPGHRLNIWSVRFAPDGRTLASSSFDRDIRLWDGETGAPLRILKGHEQAVVGVDISPDGRLLASGSDDSTVRLWRIPSGAPLATLRGTSHVYAVAFSADGRWLASAGRAHGALRTLWHQLTGLGGAGPAVRLWRVEDGRALQSLDLDDAMSIAFSRDGRWLAAASEDGKVSIWRLRQSG